MQTNTLEKLRLAVLIAGLLSAGGSAALAAGTSPSAATPDYASAQAAVKAGRYSDAMAILAALAQTDANNPDVWNLLGYSSRKLGDRNKAALYYQYALQLNPQHVGALEYQGELFVETGALEMARVNLARLESICGAGCEEYRDLAKAIASAGQS